MICFITAIAGKDDSKYQQYLRPSIPESAVSIVVGGDGSIAEKYNKGILNYKNLPNRTEKDIICFVHDDVKIVDRYFEKKLEMFFNEYETHHEDVALAGVIGTLAIGEGCFWWEKMEYTKGTIVQYYKNSNRPPNQAKTAEINTVSQVLTVDGLAMFVPVRHIDNVKFDESYGGYHFYDLDTCVDLANKNLRVFVLNIMVEHYSEGDSPVSQSFLKSRQHFINKYKFDKFPIKVRQKK